MKKRTENNKTMEVKKATVSHEVGNYEKHPFFVKKKNEAKAFLTKVGLPASLNQKKLHA